MASKVLFLRVMAVVCALLISRSALAASARQIYQKASPAVVLIIGLLDDGKGGASQGTGFLLSKKGLVATNAHVILNEETQKPLGSLYVFLKPTKVTGDLARDLTRRYDAKVVAYSPTLDLALLQIQPSATDHLARLSLADPDSVQPGDEVVAIGHPEQGGLWSLTKGVVSTVKKDFEGVQGKDIFQMDASLNRGNSGGPLLDEQGRVVGINTAIARKAQDGLAITGVNFSIQSGVLKGWMDAEGKPIVYEADAAAPAPKKESEVSSESTSDNQEQAPAEKAQKPTVDSEKIEDSESVKTAENSSENKTEAERPVRMIDMDIDMPEHPYKTAKIADFVSRLKKKTADFDSEVDDEMNKNATDKDDDMKKADEEFDKDSQK